MAFQKTIQCLLLACLLHIVLSHAVPVKKRKVKSVSAIGHPSALMNPMASAFTSKIHKNSVLASAYNMPYGMTPYGVGIGGGLISNYIGGMGYPYAQGYAAAYPGSYTNNHESYYANHLGFPNGYSVNTQSAYMPNAFGYPTIGGKKTSYDNVKSHFGGSSRVSGVSYTGHDGISSYKYGTHQEHVNMPGLTKVTFTHRYPVYPAYWNHGTFGNMGYY